MADKYAIPVVATAATEAINHADVDIVMVATPHDTHAELVLESLRAGKHVFCEKPLALNETELDEIGEAVSAAGTTLHVGFNRRYSPPFMLGRS